MPYYKFKNYTVIEPESESDYVEFYQFQGISDENLKFLEKSTRCTNLMWNDTK